jgi:hypothetical protein
MPRHAAGDRVMAFLPLRLPSSAAISVGRCASHRHPITGTTITFEAFFIMKAASSALPLTVRSTPRLPRDRQRPRRRSRPADAEDAAVRLAHGRTGSRPTPTSDPVMISARFWMVKPMPAAAQPE